MRPRQVKVRIPAGVTEGQRIRLKGRGAAGRNGGPSGDLYVTVHVGSHPLFGRSDRNLTLTVPVTYPEAALGTTVKVPTLADPVTVRIPPGTASGAVLRVRGRGVPGDGKNPGDLLVTVQVAVPHELSDEARAAVEALAATEPDAGAAVARSSRRVGGEQDVRRTPTTNARRGPSTSFPSPPNWPACTRRRCASTSGAAWSARRAPAAASRRYSDQDIALLRRIQELTAEGHNLEGVRRILQLEAENAQLRDELARMQQQYRRDLVPFNQPAAPWSKPR